MHTEPNRDSDSADILQKAEWLKWSNMDRFSELAPKKYDAGQKEHGGYLPDRPLLAELEKEAIDGWHYLGAARRRIENFKAAIIFELHGNEDRQAIINMVKEFQL